MRMRYQLLKVTCLLVSLITYSTGQAPIGTQRPCRNEQGSDNFSCPRPDQTLECYNRNQLCNNVRDCDDGSDEGLSLNALDCDGHFTGLNVSMFVCSAGDIVELELLCDGTAHCSDGGDETTALCENKCLQPYYGSCSYTRECVNSDLDLNCGWCLSGFAQNGGDKFGDCLRARFSFTQNIFSEVESAGTLSGSVTLETDGILEVAIVILIETFGADATAGADYTEASVNITFPINSPGGTVVPFDIFIINDNSVERTETFDITASSVSSTLIDGAVFISGGDSAIGRIIDDDRLSVGFEFGRYDVIESNIPQQICVVVTNGKTLTADEAVQVSTEDIGAVGGQDYDTLPSMDLIFTPVTNSRCFNVMIRDDDTDEEEECFRVNLDTPSANIDTETGRGSSMVCIQDDDDRSRLRFSMATYQTEEGASVVQACIIAVDGAVSRDITVMVESTLVGSATVGNDYVMIDFDLDFPAGSDEECFDLPVIDDIRIESTENYQLVATSDEAVFVAGGNMATVDIIDNDEARIGFVPLPFSPSVPEDGGYVECCFSVRNPSSMTLLEKSVAVNISTSDGTPGINGATSPEDYISVSREVIFDIGDEFYPYCVNITIVDDDICEEDEYFSVHLNSADDCVTIEPDYSYKHIAIIDDDVAYIVPENNITHYNVTEGKDKYVWIPLILYGQKGPGIECQVEYTTMDGSAYRDKDYVYNYGSLTFDSNNYVQYIHIDILDDTICEGHESFSVFLKSTNDACRLHYSELIVWIWDDEVHFGDDPHFSIALPGGKLLCYSVQGEHGFSFNLISNERIVMNSKFVPDARREEVTWLGSMGIIVQDSNYEGSNSTKLRFEASEKNIFIGDKIELQAKKIEKLTFSNGKLIISEAPPSAEFHYPSVLVDLQDVEISFTIKFTNQHLDMYWHSTGKKITDSHGLIGQFFRQGVGIDEARKILIMPGKEPVPVMRRPVWSFMEREEKDDQLCWTAMNPGYQGEGLIDGSYFDYLVNDILSTDFKYKKQ